MEPDMEANVKKPHPAGTVFGTMGRGLARAGSAVYRFFRKLLGVRSTRSLAGDICNILFLTILAIFMAIPRFTWSQRVQALSTERTFCRPGLRAEPDAGQSKDLMIR